MAKARIGRKVIGEPRCSQLHRAQELAAVDAYTTDLLAGVREADIVFICTPVLAIVPTIKAIAPVLKEGAIVTDGSTKAEITRGQMRRFQKAGSLSVGINGWIRGRWSQATLPTCF